MEKIIDGSNVYWKVAFLGDGSTTLSYTEDETTYVIDINPGGGNQGYQGPPLYWAFVTEENGTYTPDSAIQSGEGGTDTGNVWTLAFYIEDSDDHYTLVTGDIESSSNSITVQRISGTNYWQVSFVDVGDATLTYTSDTQDEWDTYPTYGVILHSNGGGNNPGTPTFAFYLSEAAANPVTGTLKYGNTAAENTNFNITGHHIWLFGATSPEEAGGIQIGTDNNAYTVTTQVVSGTPKGVGVIILLPEPQEGESYTVQATGIPGAPSITIVPGSDGPTGSAQYSFTDGEGTEYVIGFGFISNGTDLTLQDGNGDPQVQGTKHSEDWTLYAGKYAVSSSGDKALIVDNTVDFAVKGYRLEIVSSDGQDDPISLAANSVSLTLSSTDKSVTVWVEPSVVFHAVLYATITHNGEDHEVYVNLWFVSDDKVEWTRPADDTVAALNELLADHAAADDLPRDAQGHVDIHLYLDSGAVYDGTIVIPEYYSNATNTHLNIHGQNAAVKGGIQLKGAYPNLLENVNVTANSSDSGANACGIRGGSIGWVQNCSFKAFTSAAIRMDDGYMIVRDSRFENNAVGLDINYPGNTPGPCFGTTGDRKLSGNIFSGNTIAVRIDNLPSNTGTNPYYLRMEKNCFIANTTDFHVNRAGDFYFYGNFFGSDPSTLRTPALAGSNAAHVHVNPARRYNCQSSDDTLCLISDTEITILDEESANLLIAADQLAGREIHVVADDRSGNGAELLATWSFSEGGN